MEPERNSAGDDHCGGGRTGDVGGVEYDQTGVAGGAVVDQAEKPSSVLGGRAVGILDEQELAGVSTGTEIVVLPCAAQEVVLVDRGGMASRHGVQEAVAREGPALVDAPEPLRRWIQ